MIGCRTADAAAVPIAELDDVSSAIVTGSVERAAESPASTDAGLLRSHGGHIV